MTAPGFEPPAFHQDLVRSHLVAVEAIASRYALDFRAAGDSGPVVGTGGCSGSAVTLLPMTREERRCALLVERADVPFSVEIDRR